MTTANVCYRFHGGKSSGYFQSGHFERPNDVAVALAAVLAYIESTGSKGTGKRGTARGITCSKGHCLAHASMNEGRVIR